MNTYLGRNASVTPKFERRGSDTPSYMWESLNREEDLYDDLWYKNQFYNLGAREGEVFHKTSEKFSQPGDESEVDFYHDEFTWLIMQMEKHLPAKETEDALKKLVHISELADEALFEQDDTPAVFGSTYSEMPSMINITDLLNWKQRQDRNRLSFMMQEQAIHERNQDSLLRERLRRMSKGIDQPGLATPEVKNLELDEYKTEPKSEEREEKTNEEKKPDCWHFLRGHCKRGKYCDFSHDSKHGYPDSHKVFLGGLPFHITEAALRETLLDKGFNVVNKPKVYGGFSPQVCLASADEAKRLINERTIKIGGMHVDIRPYQAFTKKNQEKLLDVSRRSVFLGGLRKGTTTQMIKKELESLGLKIVNYPLVKAGFSPQVTLATAKQALKLVTMAKVPINGTMVDIRPSRPYTAFGRVA